MYLNLLFILLSILLPNTTAWSQDAWLKTFGGLEGNSITTLPDGSSVITGWTYSIDGTFDGMGKGDVDIFVLKLNPNGDIIWRKVFGGSRGDKGNCITATTDGYLITGWTNSDDGDFMRMGKGMKDIFVMKLNHSGDLMWRKVFGGTESDEGQSISVTLDGRILITGFTNPTTSTNIGDFKGMGKGRDDIFVIQLNQDGDVLWRRVFGGTLFDVGNSIATHSDGSAVITGWTDSNDGDFEGMRKGMGDIFAIHLDRNGDVLWKKTYGGTGHDEGKSIITKPNGDILITGKTFSGDFDFKNTKKGGWDIFVTKLDRSGGLLWMRTYGGKSDELGASITCNLDGYLLITGWTSSNDGDFEDVESNMEDLYVVKLNQNGDLLWRKVFGGSRDEEGNAIASLLDRSVLITGLTFSNDGEFLGMAKGVETDIIVMKLDSDGNLIPSSSVDEQKTMSKPILVTPNPSSTSSMIIYTLYTPSLVRFDLVNMLGQVVDVLFDGYRESGSHYIPLNSTSLTSGMYSVRMTIDTGVQTTEVCVVR